MALLSVLIFGAAIALIGQIYHIDSHMPDGIALWAAGGLLTALLLGSQPAMTVSILLAALWTWQEQFDFRAMNWPLLAYLAVALWPLLRHDWKFAARGWGLLCIVWLIGWHAYPGLDSAWDAHAHLRLFALQALGMAGCWAFAQASSHPLARAVRGDFLLFALVAAFAFTFPDLASRQHKPGGDLLPWAGGLLAGLVIYAFGVWQLVKASDLPERRRLIGVALALAYAALLAVEVLTPRSTVPLALLWNALFLGAVYWIGDLGMRRADHALINRAFAAFAVWVLARYFDTFWTLLDRSLFFMAGGILLLAGGFWLERRRRSLLGRFEAGGPQ
jgi:uncharacterized membrane protein